MLPYVQAPVLAVDLPGRGTQPAPLDQVTFALCAEAVHRQIDKAGFDRFVLAGHSLAGCSMPAMVGRLGARVAHLVFLGCTVPEDGTSCVSTLDADVRSRAEEPSPGADLETLDARSARAMFGNDMTEDQFGWCMSKMVPEAPRLVTDPVDLSPFRQDIPRTWLCTLQDAIVEPAKQHRFAANVGNCPVMDLDAGHMSMISQPERTAALLDGIAAG